MTWSSIWHLAAFALIGGIVWLTISSTVRYLKTGVSRANLQFLYLEEFDRSENEAFFWGIIGFNWIVCIAIISLTLFWVL